jgi:hypothetical protein
VEISALVRVGTDALHVAPTVGTLGVDDRSCSLVREDGLGANERRRARRRPTGSAFRSWDPLQLGIVNTTPNPK